MEQEVLEHFNELIAQYAKHKAFMEKASEQMGKFNVEVIQKVIAEHQIKASLVEDEIGEILPQFHAAISELDAGIHTAEQSKGDLGERIEELELRRVIGEISDEEFEAQSSDGRSTVESADSEITSLQEKREVLASAVSQWSDLSGTDVELAEFSPPEAEAPESEDDASVEFEESEHGASEDEDEDEDEGEGEDEGEDEDAESADDSDVSVEFEEDAAEAGDGDAEAVEAEFDDDDSADIGVEFTGESEAQDAELENGGDPRRALLLYQEGTPEEQIYPFTGEVLTVGRGRDNDIQIKNDSKVSRFHCKLFRRGENFYVEDNKSSNGTLINGELITERRLFGGEEIIIGETFFRFRIM